MNRLAHAFLALGVQEGDHVGTHLYDGNQYIEVTLAAYKVRAVPVNVNFRYVDEELTYLFDNADLKLVVTEPDLEDRAARAAATLAWTARWWSPTSATKTLLAQYPGTAPDVGERSPDDHYGLWTGGTTGMPKGVIWRQEDIYLSAIGGNGNPLLGIEPVKNLDDVVARVRKGTPLPGHAHALPAHARRRLLARVLGDPLRVVQRADPRRRLRSRVRAAGDRRGAREPADDDRRRVRAPDRRPAREVRRRATSTCPRCSCTDRAARSSRRR